MTSERKRAYNREYYQRPEVKARIKEKQRKYRVEYSQRPGVKERIKAYNREYYQRPYVKSKIREYRQLPETIAHYKEYSHLHEVNERIKKRKRLYYQQPSNRKKQLVRVRTYSNVPKHGFCSLCPRKGYTEFHHFTYTTWDVVELCKPCHLKLESYYG